MKIVNRSKNSVLCDKTVVARTFLSRLVGLLDRKDFTEGEGLVITACNSIHMFFMRFAIDAVFVDDKNRVAGLVKNLRPFRVSPIFFKSRYVVELPVGIITLSRTEVNDQLEWRE